MLMKARWSPGHDGNEDILAVSCADRSLLRTGGPSLPGGLSTRYNPRENMGECFGKETRTV